MKTNFLNSFFYKNYEIFKKTRTFLDGYVLYEYLNFNNKIENFLEIGVHKGALCSIVAEENINCTAIDPNLKLFKEIIPQNILQNINIFETKADDVDWSILPKFDLISIDGEHNQPCPTNDVKNCLPKTKKNTVILLDDYQWKDMHITRKLLIKHGLTPFLKLDQGEWWSKQDLMPFIKYLLQKNEITNFSRIFQGSIDDDCKWGISSPLAIYENISIIEKYIK
jgi:hypothetical protein